MHNEMQVPLARLFLYWFSRSEPVLVMMFALWARVGGGDDMGRRIIAKKSAKCEITPKAGFSTQILLGMIKKS